jgi:hypothetical protein
MHQSSERRPARRSWLAFIILTIVVTGCSSGIGANGENGLGNPPVTREDMLGVWEGTSLASCGFAITVPSRCNSQQLVTIALTPGDDNKIGGYYKCAYGNMNCYNMNTTGKIGRVSIDRSLLTVLVMMPDGTSCRYQGRNVNNMINGGYSCSSGGTQFEQGTWRAKHEY